MLATVAALIVGKAVLVANHMPFLSRYDRAPLVQPILFKTAIYWVVVFLVRLLDTLLHGSAGLSVLGPGSVERHSPFGERDFASRWSRLLPSEASTVGKSG